MRRKQQAENVGGAFVAVRGEGEERMGVRRLGRLAIFLCRGERHQWSIRRGKDASVVLLLKHIGEGEAAATHN